jgi:ribosomal protein S18 acetylase RimI-like enzyme
MIKIVDVTQEYLPQVREFWKESWGDDFLVVHGDVYRPDFLEGLLALDGNEIIGLITYSFTDGECEIISVDSTREDQGIGTALIERVIKKARDKKCMRIFLITTNDNLRALGFYQKRGFEMVKINRGAVTESRKMKPNIPLTGANHIPIRDEIELEMKL